MKTNVKGRNILVTGGTGFVGSHLVEMLVKRGALVVVPLRSRDPRSYFFLQHLDRSVILANGDIKEYPRMLDIISKYEIDTIFHLAAQPIVTTAYINPLETIESNIMGTANILEAARQCKAVKAVIITSSDKAYGKIPGILGSKIDDSGNRPSYTENHPLAGDHPYEASKSAADILAHTYWKTYHMPLVTVRFGNIYGPGDLNFTRIVPGIMQSILSKSVLKLRSDGTFVRDYVYVGDIVSAYMWVLEHMDAVSGESFNVASETSESVIGLIKKARKIVGKPFTYSIEKTQMNEIPYQHLSWEKIYKLGWRPKYPLSKGLTLTYRWYKKNRRALSL